jgi:hypothetical protein
MKSTLVRITTTIFLMHAMTSSAWAQRVLDWPLRTTAGPEAVTRGVEAAFWNPAAIIAGVGRGEAIIADQRTPDVIGLSGFAAAASWRLDTRTVIAGGYQHVSIDGLGETSTSPLSDIGEATFSIAEDQISLGASHVLGTAVTAGAGVRSHRSNESEVFESTTSLTAGFIALPAVPLHPVIGASIFTEKGGVRYIVGAEASMPDVTDGLNMRAGYGIRGGANSVAVEHRLGVTGLWRQMISVSAGVVTADAGAERSWEPVLGASLRVSRYELGVLRESLASDFGAAYSFRFRVGLK